jgi:hypothetical protein
MKTNRRFGEKYRLHLQSWQSVSNKQAEKKKFCLASILKQEAVRSSEMSVKFKCPALLHVIPENSEHIPRGTVRH